MHNQYHIRSVDDLQDVVRAVMHYIDQGERVVVLDGEMGAGKTTLVGAICQELQVEEEASSPTYAIVNTYCAEVYGEIYHFDFYRLRDEQEAWESGLDELLESGQLCFIEWAERVPKLLPEKYVRVGIEANVDTTRTVRLGYNV